MTPGRRLLTVRIRAAWPLSEIFGDRLELGDRLPGLRRIAVRRMRQAMVDMIVDQGLLGRRDRLFDRMKLLGQIEATASRLDHADGFAQMPLGPLQSIDDLGVGFMNDVSHDEMLSSWRGYGQTSHLSASNGP